MRAIHIFAVVMSTFAGPAMGEVPAVATDIAPVHGLVSRVMAGVGSASVIVPPEASVHAYDLRPSAAAALDNADVFFWIGESLTPWLAGSVETLASKANVVSLLDAEGTILMPFREDDAFEESDAHDHEHDHGHDHDHDDGGMDPHAWLDPANAERWLDLIAGVLAETDPDNAQAYLANAAAGKAEVAAAFDAAEALLTGAEATQYVVFHDAYQYFEQRFGLRPIGAVTLGDAALPGPQRLANLRDRLAEMSTKCVLVEPAQNTDLIGSLSEDPEIRIVEIDPLGTGIPNGPDFYPVLVTAIAESFAACG